MHAEQGVSGRRTRTKGGDSKGVPWYVEGRGGSRESLQTVYNKNQDAEREKNTNQ